MQASAKTAAENYLEAWRHPEIAGLALSGSLLAGQSCLCPTWQGFVVRGESQPGVSHHGKAFLPLHLICPYHPSVASSGGLNADGGF